MGSSSGKVRLAYVVSHPIQYQAELLRRISADPAIDLCVFFCSDFSLRSYSDAGFGVSVQWDVPLTQGYNFKVLARWRDTDAPSPTRPISYGLFRALRHGLNGLPFDAVWIHGYASINAIHAMLAAKALGIPVLLRAESWLADRTRSGGKLLLKALAFRALAAFVDAVLPIGTQNKAYWAHYFGNDFPSFLMPYAVDNTYFAERTLRASESRAALQAELALDPARPVILFASKLQPRKHADHLLEAYLQLRAHSTLVPYLLFVGDGEMREQLQSRAAVIGGDNIRFLGFRNQSELPRFFDLSDVFVLPSRHEAWGLITNEAMAAGLSVIVSDNVGCAADLVRNGQNGFIYPVGDVDALCAALEAALQPGAAEAMGRQSRDIIATWSYAEDLYGLKAALRCITGRRVVDS